MRTTIVWTVYLLAAVKTTRDLWPYRRPPFEWVAELLAIAAAVAITAVAFTGLAVTS